MASASTSPKQYEAMNVDDRRDHSNGRRYRGTVRRDTVRRILENGWVDGAVCEGRYTDDYKRDAARNYNKGAVDTQEVINAMDRVAPKHCWIALREDGRQVITVYWSFQSYSVEIDTRKVRFNFGADDEEADEEDADGDEGGEQAIVTGDAVDVFEELSEGDAVLWDGKSQPLTVTVGYEAAREQIAEFDHVDSPEVWVEGPRGGEKRLTRSDGSVFVSTFSLSSSGREAVEGLRVVERDE